MSRGATVCADGSIEWPRGSRRDAFDEMLVKVADEGIDDAALELLHRDCVRASIAWNRFLGGAFVLPRWCPGGADERSLARVHGVLERALRS